jgi:hypothetical protein
LRDLSIITSVEVRFVKEKRTEERDWCEKSVPVINKGAKPHTPDRRCQGQLLQTVRCAQHDEEGRWEAGATILVKIASAVGKV